LVDNKVDILKCLSSLRIREYPFSTKGDKSSDLSFLQSYI
jgi:hypothetical protein